MIKKIFYSFIIIVLLFNFAEKAFSDSLSAYKILKPENSNSIKSSLPLKLVEWYQKNISSINGPKCMFYPTCSEYFKNALIRYGLIWAILMTTDRMFYRENHPSMKYYTYIKKYGRYYDPINNHFKLRDNTK